MTTRISVVVPIRNEERSLPLLLERLESLAKSMPDIALEAVFVNDGSDDASLELLLASLARPSPISFVVVDLSRNFGKEAALSAGLSAATGEAVIPIDADLQDPPELVPRMVERWRAGAEVVLAKRSDRRADSWFKRTTARWFYQLQNATSDVAVPADVGDFRLMDRAVVDVINSLPESRRFMKGLFAWAGFRTEVVEYSRPSRSSGESHFNFFRLSHLALEGITSFSLAPLRVATIIGLFVALAAIAKGGWIFLRTLLFGVDVPGYASIFTAVALLGGIQLVCLGVIGEYIGRTYLEAKRRPAYVVRRIYRAGTSGG